MLGSGVPYGLWEPLRGCRQLFLAHCPSLPGPVATCERAPFSACSFCCGPLVPSLLPPHSLLPSSLPHAFLCLPLFFYTTLPQPLSSSSPLNPVAGIAICGHQVASAHRVSRPYCGYPPPPFAPPAPTNPGRLSTLNPSQHLHPAQCLPGTIHGGKQAEPGWGPGAPSSLQML